MHASLDDEPTSLDGLAISENAGIDIVAALTCGRYLSSTCWLRIPVVVNVSKVEKR
jgi:hypothetical protein